MISLIGSTGSIGKQALDVLDHLGERPVALAAGRNVSELENQCRKYRPEMAVMSDAAAASDLRVRLSDTPVKVLGGPDSVCEAAAHPRAVTTLVASPGISGLLPTLAAIGAVPRLALANKESMVSAGRLVMKRMSASKTLLLPVDSELSAVFLCLEGVPRELVRRVILTASGGPFYGRSPESLHDVTIEDALKHPSWKMGRKITIDSATLLNKGYEVIETMHYFGMPLERISVSIHRESIIHAVVEYVHKSPYIYMTAADMRLPIQFALTYPEVRPPLVKPLDLSALPSFAEEPPDQRAFPCFALALEAAGRGGLAGAVLAAAGETAVARFLNGEIRFTDIAKCVESALARVPSGDHLSLGDILEADAEARLYTRMVNVAV